MTAKTSGILVLALGVAACGGGGGNGNSPQAPAGSDLKITAANGTAAAAKSWQAANGSAGYADMAGTPGVVATKPGVAAKADAGLPSTRSLVHLLQKVPFGPEVLPCQVSGSITVSGNLANPLTLTAGDEINMDADACDDGAGEIIDGVMNMTVDAFGGDFLGGLYELTMTLELANFQVATEADVQTSNGDVTVTLDTRAAPAVSAGVSGDAMTVDASAESATLYDFSSLRTLDAGVSPAPYTLAANGTLDSSRLPGLVRYSTPVTFAGFDGGYPGTGELLVVGDDSSARLVAVDDVNVRIDIDLDGDDVVDATIETTWAALDE